MTSYPFLKNPEAATGVWQGNVLTIHCKEEFTYDVTNKPEVLKAIADVASAQAGCPIQVELRRGMPESVQAAPAPKGSMGDLKLFMQQHQK